MEDRMLVKTLEGELIPLQRVRTIGSPHAEEGAWVRTVITEDGDRYTVDVVAFGDEAQTPSTCFAALPGCYVIEVPADRDMAEWEQFPRTRIIGWRVNGYGTCEPVLLEDRVSPLYILLDDGTVTDPDNRSWESYAEFETQMRKEAANRLAKVSENAD
jgi:hypothetical protein